MGKKRPRPLDKDEEVGGWDSLAWRKVDVTLQQDDGWDGGEGEGTLFGLLEEVDGNDYKVEKSGKGMLKIIPRPQEKSVDTVNQPGTKKKKRKRTAEVSIEDVDTADIEEAQHVSDVKEVPQVSSKAKGKKAKTKVAEEAASVAAEGDVTSSSEVVDRKKKKVKQAAAVPIDKDESPAPKVIGHPPKGQGKNFKKNQKKKAKYEAQEAAKLAAQRATAPDDDKDIVSDDIKNDSDAEEEQQVEIEDNLEIVAEEGEDIPLSAVQDLDADVHEDDVPSSKTVTPVNWELSESEVVSMLQWSCLCELHPALLFNLHKLGFTDPTPIQRAVLPKAILGRKDIVGVAETGSGKTLAYGLPLLNSILARKDAAGGSDEDGKLQALILCPTRELALQVTSHLTAVAEGTGVRIVSIVGGLAEVKQARQLKRRPEVVVATPGRLWEMRNAEPYLRDLSQLKFLVVDEADRMMEKGRFEELRKLLSIAKPPPTQAEIDAAAKEREMASSKQKRRAGRGSKGGEMLLVSEAFKATKTDNKKFASKSTSNGKRKTGADESWMSEEGWLVNSEIVNSDGEADFDMDVEVEHGAGAAAKLAKLAFAPCPRQSFIFSATMLLGSKPLKKGAKGKSGRSEDGNSALQRIMAEAGMSPKASIVDLSGNSTSTNNTESGDKSKGKHEAEAVANIPNLPSTLTLAHVKSLQMDKDVWLYAFLMQYPGRTLVFTNAVVMARRIMEVLRLLNVPCGCLHAQMQQKQRLKALDSLKSNTKGVLVATDVAARGLDIPEVDHVVHYDVPRTAADFVHRSGRTARAGRGGFSLTIVSPSDEGAYTKVCSALASGGAIGGTGDAVGVGGGTGGVGLPPFPHPPALFFDRCRERVSLAGRVARCDAARGKAEAAKTEMKVWSNGADIEPDEHAMAVVDSEGGAGRGGKEATRLARAAMKALQADLLRPLVVDRRKFVPVAQKLIEMSRQKDKTAQTVVEEIIEKRKKGRGGS